VDCLGHGVFSGRCGDPSLIRFGSGLAGDIPWSTLVS
jgi:hypothetical protein